MRLQLLIAFLLIGCQSDTSGRETLISSGLPVLCGNWIQSPDIEICNNMPISVRKIVSNLKWWRRLSAIYTYNNLNRSDCQTPTKIGWIRFSSADRNFLSKNRWLAYTTVKINNYGNVDYAEIFLKKENNNWVIRHEIGHAYGWQHAPEYRVNHLMHPSPIGRGTRGLEIYGENTYGI